MNSEKILCFTYPDLTASSYDNCHAYWGSTHEQTWKVIKNNDFISGMFVWSGFDFLGEPEPYGESQGVRSKTADQFHAMWRLKYHAGTIKAISRKDGKTVLEKEIHTAGKPAKIVLTADRYNLKADGKDLSFITAIVTDKIGNMVPDAANLINFKISGNGFIAGVDNGCQTSMEPFKANYRKAFNGICLLVLQTDKKPGKFMLNQVLMV